MDAISSAMGGLGSIFKGGGVGPGGTAGTLPGATGAPVTSGGIFSNPLSLLQLGSGVFGTIGNIQASNARNKVLSREMAQMDALNKMTPAEVSQGIAALQQPLSNNLVSSVGNAVQGQMAERGLAQAPGVYSTVLAQALAPYQLQQQQMAQQAFFQKLGLPISARPSPFGPFPETTNTSPIWQSLFNKQFGNYSGANGGTVPISANSPYGQPSMDWGTSGLYAPTDPGNLTLPVSSSMPFNMPMLAPSGGS